MTANPILRNGKNTARVHNYFVSTRSDVRSAFAKDDRVIRLLSQLFIRRNENRRSANVFRARVRIAQPKQRNGPRTTELETSSLKYQRFPN